MTSVCVAERGCDRIDDEALVEAFEALEIAPMDFRHREHVRLAFAMLRGAEFCAAAARFKRALVAFAASVGAAGKYHETLTLAYVALVGERMQAEAYSSSLEFVERNPDLLDHRAGAISQYYDVAAITACPIARRVFVLPRR
jgi:hypothetical protein